ncbi:Protein of unknown function [Leuconostoc citreum]|nr:Protein of unknown function [Leuconostoc citreum]
MAIDVKKFNL